MLLHEIFETEANPVYAELEALNSVRQLSFLESIVISSIKADRPFLSHDVVKALNFLAIACLHTSAGEYRPCEVRVGEYQPPMKHRVQALMDDLVNLINRFWLEQDALHLGAFVLWRLNYIHPFINGNGRTARAACYYVICLRLGGLLPGKVLLPELLKENRAEYVKALQGVDESVVAGKIELAPLKQLIAKLLNEQLASAAATNPPQEQPATT